MQRLEPEKLRRLRVSAQEGLYQSILMLGFGATAWLGFWMYDTFSTVIQQTQESLGLVLEGDRPGVHPTLATDEAWETLHKRQVAKYGGMHPYVAVWWRKMAGIRPKIREDGTTAVMMTKEYMWLKEQESTLLTIGYIQAVDPETGTPTVVAAHPLDVAAKFVLGNRWYWAGVLSLSLLPAATHAQEIMEEYRK